MISIGETKKKVKSKPSGGKSQPKSDNEKKPKAKPKDSLKLPGPEMIEQITMQNDNNRPQAFSESKSEIEEDKLEMLAEYESGHPLFKLSGGTQNVRNLL